MSKRHHAKQTRERIVVIFRGGKLGYYSRDRVEGGASPIYATQERLVAARRARTALADAGQKAKWEGPF
jgi:hypothetical protein